MYWLRWHYHVKDIAGTPYKIKQNKDNQKRQKRRQSVVAGRQQLFYCAVYNHDRLIIDKRRPEKYSLELATVHSSRQTTAGCSTHVPKPLGWHDHEISPVNCPRRRELVHFRYANKYCTIKLPVTVYNIWRALWPGRTRLRLLTL